MTERELADGILAGDMRKFARLLTRIEHDDQSVLSILSLLNITNNNTPVVGITGPPGAGKSSLIAALIACLRKQALKVGIIAVDPSSPFHHGAILGDRIRMHDHTLDSHVFIRSLATRGALGGLAAPVYQMIDAYKAFGFDVILIETVGVGQSEVDIARLADTTVVVLVPESGDEVQTLKSGVMEIADIYALNKADREGASTFLKNLNALVHDRPVNLPKPSVIATQAIHQIGIEELWSAIQGHANSITSEKRNALMREKGWQMFMQTCMQRIGREAFLVRLEKEMVSPSFNLYAFISRETTNLPLG